MAQEAAPDRQPAAPADTALLDNGTVDVISAHASMLAKAWAIRIGACGRAYIRSM
jgi:hypothetical protein